MQPAERACARRAFFFYCCGDRRDLHSFPTRRSSDLSPETMASNVAQPLERQFSLIAGLRSEEHTSELQSCRDLVRRLLLEKKKPDTVTCPALHNYDPREPRDHQHRGSTAARKRNCLT